MFKKGQLWSPTGEATVAVTGDITLPKNMDGEKLTLTVPEGMTLDVQMRLTVPEGTALKGNVKFDSISMEGGSVVMIGSIGNDNT